MFSFSCATVPIARAAAAIGLLKLSRRWHITKISRFRNGAAPVNFFNGAMLHRAASQPDNSQSVCPFRHQLQIIIHLHPEAAEHLPRDLLVLRRGTTTGRSNFDFASARVIDANFTASCRMLKITTTQRRFMLE